MDGRDFGPQRSVHGPPPPLLSGLAMDSHRVGAATAGRLPASGLPGPLPPGKYMAGLNLHPHPGKCPAPCPSPPVFPGRSTRPGPPVHSRPGLGDSPSVGHGGAGRFGSQGWETPGPGAKASPSVARLGYLFRSVLGPREPKAGVVARATGGDSNPRGPGGTSLGWSFQNLGEKRTNRPPHPARHPLPELESFSWQTLFLALVGPPGFCSQLHHPRRAGSLAVTERRGMRECAGGCGSTVTPALGPWPRGGRDAPFFPGRTAALGTCTPVGGRRPRPSGTPCFPARKRVRRCGRDTETGPSRSRT
uniref:Trinucleotide repeat containing 18 n=1 Tax=Pan troglodytes TaxID=9598 RepID=A0A2I3S4T5_PANTR